MAGDNSGWLSASGGSGSALLDAITKLLNAGGTNGGDPSLGLGAPQSGPASQASPLSQGLASILGSGSGSPPTDPTSNINTYANLPSSMQAGGASFGSGGGAAALQALAGGQGTPGPLDPMLGGLSGQNGAGSNSSLGGPALPSPGNGPLSSLLSGASTNAGRAADPTSDIAAYANLPSNMQAGGANFGPQGGGAGSGPLDALIAPRPVKAEQSAGGGPGATPPAGNSSPLALMGAPSSPTNPRDPSGVLGDIIAAGRQAQGGNQDAQSGPQLAGAPGTPLPSSSQASGGQGSPSGLPAMPVRKPIGLLEALGDFALGGMPTAIKAANYRGQMDNYQNALAARMAQMRMGVMAAAVGSDQSGASGTAQSGGSSGSGPLDSILNAQSSGGASGASGSAIGAGGAAPGVGTTSLPGYTASQRRALAQLAILDNKPENANTILQRKVVKGTDGYLYDEQTGDVVGRIPDHSVVNGQNTDLGDPSNTNRFYPTYNAEDQPTFDQYGRPVGVAPLTGSIQGAAARAGATANATNASEASYAGRKAYGTAAGTGAGAAMTEVITVPDGHGGSTQMTRAQYLRAMNGASGPGAAGPGLGYTPSKADQDFDSSQATGASTELNSDMDARPGALQDLNNAHQALSYVQAHKMDRLSPHIAAGAAYLRSLPAPALQALGIPANGIDRAANDPAIYQRLSAQNLLSFSKSNLPSRYTEREMAVANRVIPQLSTPNDAAAMHWGLQAAIANKAVQRADFASNYSGPKSRQGVEQAWNGTPQGQASLFEDPAFKSVTLGGKPAVVYVRKAGKLYGVVGAGTGSPTSFLASGQ